MTNQTFPTFARLWQRLSQRSSGEQAFFAWSEQWKLSWRISPWWPADTWASKQRSLLQLLSVAVAERLEVGPLVRNLATEHRGSYRRRLRRLAKRLASGTPLIESLEQTPDVLSDDQVLALRFGSQSGTLPETLKVMLEAPNPSSARVGAILRQAKSYFVMLLLIGLLVLSFWLLKIVPSIRAICDDFDLHLPGATEWVVNIANFVVQFWWAIALGGLTLAWLVWSGPSRRFFRRGISSQLLRPVLQLRSANLLRLLAVALGAGRPLPGAISTLARYHFDKTIRLKLLFVRNEIEQGADIWASMAEARLLSADESQAVALAPSTESRGWTMRRLAEWKRDRVARRTMTIVSLLQTLVILAFACAVLLTALAMWGPLIELINRWT